MARSFHALRFLPAAPAAPACCSSQPCSSARRLSLVAAASASRATRTSAAHSGACSAAAAQLRQASAAGHGGLPHASQGAQPCSSSSLSGTQVMKTVMRPRSAAAPAARPVARLHRHRAAGAAGGQAAAVCFAVRPAGGAHPGAAHAALADGRRSPCGRRRWRTFRAPFRQQAAGSGERKCTRHQLGWQKRLAGSLSPLPCCAS